MADYPYPEVRLSNLSGIAHSFHVVSSSEGAIIDALIIKFEGSYGVGHEGNSDASYMRAIAAAGLEAWRPNALIFDFSELDYTWGDMLSAVLSVGKGKVSAFEILFRQEFARPADFKPGNIPTRVVVSDRCGKAVRSLLAEEMAEDPTKWVFDSLEAALSAV